MLRHYYFDQPPTETMQMNPTEKNYDS